MNRMRPNATDALIVIDVQNDFCSQGALAVPGAEDVLRPIASLIPAFQTVVATQDWHTPGHMSFASTHGRAPFESTTLDYGEQILWPDHCVMGGFGAEFHADLDLRPIQLVIRKGFHPRVDSYSGFMEADKRTPTGLAGYLAERGVSRVFLAGLATDFCVAWTARDARAAGLHAVVIEDACRGIDLDGSLDAAWADMTEAGVERAGSKDILGQ